MKKTALVGLAIVGLLSQHQPTSTGRQNLNDFVGTWQSNLHGPATVVIQPAASGLTGRYSSSENTVDFTLSKNTYGYIAGGTVTATTFPHTSSYSEFWVGNQVAASVDRRNTGQTMDLSFQGNQVQTLCDPAEMAASPC
jgi:hypothetical protein